MPKISVVIPLYNKEKHIKETLSSVLKQDFEDFEVIVVNDGSTDNSLNVAKSVNDERIQWYTIENQGVSYARNYGIEKSSGDLIAFLDADDYWYPSHLMDIIELVHRFPDCGMYAKSYETVLYGDKKFKAKFLGIDDSYLGILTDFFHSSLISQIAWTSALAIPKKVLDIHGHFDITLRTGEDTDLWTRIVLREKVAFSSKVSAQKKMYNPNNHLSQSPFTTDKVRFLKKFIEEEKSNESFKKYMDQNRYSVAIERKLVDDYDNFNAIISQINYQNLNNKQRILLRTPTGLLKLMRSIQQTLLKRGIYLSAFR